VASQALERTHTLKENVGYGIGGREKIGKYTTVEKQKAPRINTTGQAQRNTWIAVSNVFVPCAETPHVGAHAQTRAWILPSQLEAPLARLLFVDTPRPPK
jgi:hypothetical protein